MPGIIKDLVLIGGGHSHAIVLKMFGMKPLPGVRLTLITDASDTPYSGMLPGHIAGLYTRAECHINLRQLTKFAQAKLYIDKVVGLDLRNNKIFCQNYPPVRFDILSIDIGSTPATISVPGAADYAIPAKPVAKLLAKWDEFTRDFTAKFSPDVTPQPPSLLEKRSIIAIVGGGAGGVELALSIQAHLQRILGDCRDNLEIHLFQREPQLMPKSNPTARRLFQTILTQCGIQLHLNETVCKVEPQQVICESGLKLTTDAIFWVTQASAPQWLGKAGLETDEDGFVKVNNYLQSISHPLVFAAGDIAAMVNYQLPKAGVFAVRQGKPLFNNLQRIILGKPLESYKPQKDYLSLIGTGDGSAIAVRGCFTSPPSKLLWYWKDWIDRRFMERFSNLPD
ncbi:MAG: FAD-dependent oxidoreductase [Nostocaceae cyanobacterium]|nr:FAD-dependent oxidoreductase [Nostocaceae cyanobacterium]